MLVTNHKYFDLIQSYVETQVPLQALLTVENTTYPSYSAFNKGAADVK